MGSGHLATLLLAALGWQGTYGFLAVITLASGGIAFRWMVEPPQQQEQQQQQLEARRTSRRTRVEAVCCVLGDFFAVAGLYVPYTCFSDVLLGAGRWCYRVERIGPQKKLDGVGPVDNRPSTD